jgi:hypothetical protein
MLQPTWMSQPASMSEKISMLPTIFMCQTQFPRPPVTQWLRQIQKLPTIQYFIVPFYTNDKNTLSFVI